MPEWTKYVDTGLKVAGWAASTVMKFINGDRSEAHVPRLVSILPPELRSEVEHHRQRELMRKELEEDFK